MPKQNPASTVIKQAPSAQSASAAPYHWNDLGARKAPAPECESSKQEELEQRVAQQVAQQLAQQVAQRVETPLQAIRAAVDGIQQAQLGCHAEWERRLIHLAAAMAARVIRRELKHAPDITLDLVREALQMAAGSPQLRIELNPQDYETLGEPVAAMAHECSRGANIEVVAAASVRPGGCRVETRFGAIDQQIETQLARLEEELN